MVKLKQKVFLIVNSHSVHRAQKVKTWVEHNSDKLELLFIPDYSPDLDTDEMANQDVKSNALGTRRPHN